MIESGIQAPPKNVMSMPNRFPAPFSSSSRAPKLDSTKPAARGVSARTNVDNSAIATRPALISATAGANPTTPTALETNHMQTVSTDAAANTHVDR